MKLLRLLRALVLVPFALFLTLFISIVTLAWTLILGRDAASVQGLAAWWARSICAFGGVSVTVTGNDKLDPAKPYIFAANHQSQFDIFALQGFLGIDFRWLAKKELFKVPIWGAAMRKAGYIPVDRSHGRNALKSIEEAAQRIASGTSVIIFPEGTRTLSGDIQDFKAGAMVLAIKSGVEIVPVAIKGTYEILPKGKLLINPGNVWISIGSPIKTSGYTAKDKQTLAGLLQEKVHKLFTSIPATEKDDS